MERWILSVLRSNPNTTVRIFLIYFYLLIDIQAIFLPTHSQQVFIPFITSLLDGYNTPSWSLSPKFSLHPNFFPTPARGLFSKYKFDHVIPLLKMLQWPPGALGQLKLFITKAPRIQSSQPRRQPGFCHIPPSSHTEQLPLLTACHILSGLRAFAHAVPSTWITLYLTTPHVSFHFLTVTSPGKCWVHPKLNNPWNGVFKSVPSGL